MEIGSTQYTSSKGISGKPVEEKIFPGPLPAKLESDNICVPRDNFTPETGRIPQWKVLVYSSAPGDIDRFAVNSIRDMEKTGSTENVGIAVQFSRLPFNPEEGWKGTRRYFLQKHTPSQKDTLNDVSSPVAEFLADTDMSNLKNLSNFIEWGMKNYPSEKTMLVIGGHSAGFAGVVTNAAKTAMMSIPDVKKAMNVSAKETGMKPDVLVFNSCLMSQAEVQNEMKDSASYIIASEKPEYKEGIPLGSFIEKLNGEIGKGDVSPQKASELLLDASCETPDNTPAISITDALKIEQLTKSIDQLAKNLLTTETSRDNLIQIIRETERAYVKNDREPLFADYRDLGDFARNLVSSPLITDDNIKKSAEQVIDAVDSAVVSGRYAAFNGLPAEEQKFLKENNIDADTYKNKLHGISIYLPDRDPGEEMGEQMRQKIMGIYGALNFSNSTHWDEFIHKRIETGM